MARHPNRVQVFSVAHRRLQSMGHVDAEELVSGGQARWLDKQHTKLELMSQSASCRVVATLTMGDMIANAAAVLEQRNNRARIKVDRWKKTHDTYAVTIVAGKVFIPDPAAAAERAAKLDPQNR